MIGHVIKIALGIGLLEVDRGRQRLIAQRQHTDAGLSVLALRDQTRSEEHTSELQSRLHLVCRLLLEKKIWTAREPGLAAGALSAVRRSRYPRRASCARAAATIRPRPAGRFPPPQLRTRRARARPPSP